MKFNYPRPLSFAHPDYQVGCAGTEVPFLGKDSKTYLYVWNIKNYTHAYYCFESDLFIPEEEYSIIE